MSQQINLSLQASTQPSPPPPGGTWKIKFEKHTHRIPNQHELRRRALGVEGIDGGRGGRHALLHRARVADAAARRLPAAGRVDDGLGGRARVGVEDQVDDGGRGAVPRAGGGLAGAEDVDARARGPAQAGRADLGLGKERGVRGRG